MHSRSLILVLLLACGVCGQNTGNSGAHANNVEKGYPFGKLRLSEDGKQEELLPSVEVEIPSSNQETVVSSNVQPLPSPCVGVTRPLTKLPYPKDKTKFIQCRDEYHYEILTCPEGVEYNEQTNTCDVPSPIINRCEREKPCLNDGHCTVQSNSTFKCTCRPDWTGDRCEIPMNSCVKKPCGPNAECRPLKTNDYEQDYVCICHGLKGYGLNCREAVPNPCLSSEEQFYPYAFSQRAYIQCDGELIFFQPCGASLYWSQEDKICDRKRPTKTEKPAFMKVPSDSSMMINQQSAADTETVDESAETTTTLRTEQIKPPMQHETEQQATFIPARVANRQQLLASMQQRETEQPKQETTGPFGTSADLFSARQELASKQKQWPTQQFDNTVRRPMIVSSGRSQSMMQNAAQSWTPTSTERPETDSNMEEAQFQSTHQQQNFQQKPQGFGSQQWLNQLPESNKQSGQRFAAQPQTWQTSQSFQQQQQQQQRFPEQGQQTLMESAQTAPQTVTGSQGFQSQNTREQDQTWQTRPNTFSSGSQVAPSWQTTQNRPRTQDLTQQQSLDTNTPAFNNAHSQGFQGQNVPEQEESWQSKSTSIVGQPQQNWQNSQSFQSQQNTQRFAAQPQSWQGEFASVETSTAAQNVVRLQGFKNQNFQDQEQSWQNNVQKPAARGPSSQVFAFKPTQWSDSTKQETKLPSQTRSQNQQVLMGESNSQMQNTPSTFQQQPREQQTFEQQQQPWSSKQSLQKTQVNNFGDFKIQPTDNMNAHSSMTSQGQTWSQNGNQGVFQGLATQSQRAPGQSEAGQQVATEQRRPPNAIPTKLFGSWASRSM